jgi:alkyl sulfatase BDS1-like metallo-beta-lactamase superfamily hydrolase
MSTQHGPSFADNTDFTNANRGLVASLNPCTITAADGHTVWNSEDHAFIQNDCPPTANPKLWRQGQLTSIQGLFEVTEGVYQVRGFDLSNMTLVESDTGVIVIDPLTCIETAAEALALYRSVRGNRAVSAVIYSHSHIDHFGGAAGVISPDQLPTIPIIAPEGFMEEAVSENMLLGPAMIRRAIYMYGSKLPKAPDGQIGCGIGASVPRGTGSLIPPKISITQTGDERVVDGVRIIFQMVPGSEAPSEMNFYFPDQRALYIAECAVHSLHNIITLRGAQVRDARAWSRYLDESLVLFVEDAGGKEPSAQVLFAGHNWPTWGTAEITKMISEQRDLYAYLHDQTVRLMNHGKTGIEIAEELVLPVGLQTSWHAQGFYGSVSHNVKGIYQRYMGWFDGDAAHLWEYPAAENGKRYVSCMGGMTEVIRKAEEFSKAGDLRFAATLLGHAVASDRTHRDAKRALACVFTKLGHGAENATWRNFYLSAAADLGAETSPTLPGQKQGAIGNGLKPTQSVEQWFDLLAVRLNGPQSGDERFAIDFHVIDEGVKKWRVNVSNGALTYHALDLEGLSGVSGLTLVLHKRELFDILGGGPLHTQLKGDASLISRLLTLME